MYNFKLFLLCLLFSSCEGYTEGQGIVVDADTKQPLDSVLVESFVSKVAEKNFESEMTTDSSGTWWGSTGLVGCGFKKCASLFVRFSRNGYQTLEVENPTDSIIFLVK